jgi:hypothetical protein
MTFMPDHRPGVGVVDQRWQDRIGGDESMKRFLGCLFLGILALYLTGCTDSGINSLKTTATTQSVTTTSQDLSALELSASDLAAVEAGLLASRLQAAQVAPSIQASIATGSSPEGEPRIGSAPPPAMSPFEMAGHRFEGHRDGNEFEIRRGENGCQVGWSENGSAPPRLMIASTPCSVERLADGGVRIVRPEGEELIVEPATNASGTGELVVDGITWSYTWGTETLLTLTNTSDGHILTVVESDNGELSIARPGRPPHHAHWNADGELAGEFPTDGRSFRFAAGTFK